MMEIVKGRAVSRTGTGYDDVAVGDGIFVPLVLPGWKDVREGCRDEEAADEKRQGMRKAGMESFHLVRHWTETGRVLPHAIDSFMPLARIPHAVV